jgi:hypothetical protein
MSDSVSPVETLCGFCIYCNFSDNVRNAPKASLFKTLGWYWAFCALLQCRRIRLEVTVFMTMDGTLSIRSREAPTTLVLRLKPGCVLPAAYVCPLTLGIMNEPIVDPDDDQGRAMDRLAFERYQLQYHMRPLTGEPRDYR